MSQHISIPPELLTDLLDVCQWLIYVGSPEHEVPPAIAEFWSGQAKLVLTWLEEYAPKREEVSPPN